MMADNMFAGKHTILTWLNSALQLKLERIEDTCNGAVACQVMDCLHPGSLNMRKVDFNLRNEYEFMANYKELQKAFQAMGVEKLFNPAALSKGKMQDNNEFMQWYYGYWNEVTGGMPRDDYDAIGVRQSCKTGDWKKFTLGDASSARPAAGATIAAVRRGPAPVAPRAAAAASAKVPLARTTSKGSGPPSRQSSAALEQMEAVQAEAEALREQITELKLKVDTSERERDFYFEKLRDIEILCQAPELQEIPAIRIVEKILYAADSAEAKEAMTEAQQVYGASFEQPAAEDAAPAAAEVAAAE